MKSPSRLIRRSSSCTDPVPTPITPVSDAAARWLVLADLERAHTTYTPTAQIARRPTLNGPAR